MPYLLRFHIWYLRFDGLCSSGSPCFLLLRQATSSNTERNDLVCPYKSMAFIESIVRSVAAEMQEEATEERAYRLGVPSTIREELAIVTSTTDRLFVPPELDVEPVTIPWDIGMPSSREASLKLKVRGDRRICDIDDVVEHHEDVSIRRQSPLVSTIDVSCLCPGFDEKDHRTNSKITDIIASEKLFSMRSVNIHLINIAFEALNIPQCCE